MAMSKKDYGLIAKAIRAAYDMYDDSDAFNDGVYAAARELAAALIKDNPRFDTSRFLKACEKD